MAKVVLDVDFKPSEEAELSDVPMGLVVEEVCSLLLERRPVVSWATEALLRFKSHHPNPSLGTTSSSFRTRSLSF
jgi:hypothetical protein